MGKALGYNGIPNKVWNVFCTLTDEIEIVGSSHITKLKMEENFHKLENCSYISCL
jgi:hypothetical protein